MPTTPTFQDFSLLKKEIDIIKRRNKLEKFSEAFIFCVLEKLFPNFDPDENITDGNGDHSIDSYYIDNENKEINIFQFKSTEKFNKAKKKDALGDRDISDFIIKLEQIWNKDEKILSNVNVETKEAIKEIWEALNKGYIKTNIYFISNHYHTIRSEYKIQSIQKNMSDKFRATLRILSLKDLIKLTLKNESNPVDIKLKLKGRNYFNDATGEIKALIGEINALNLLESILDDKKKLREDVFNENIRVYLQQNTKINKQIYSSIHNKEENLKFFFYNNGITAICDSFEHQNTDSPVVKLENFQIVNGGQTIHTLYEAYKGNLIENIKDIYLLIRIYEVKNREIGQSIARFTNTQNPVRSRDVMSNYDIQIKLQKELERMRWYYERKKYEYKDIKSKKKIDAEKAGQVILSFYLEKPGSAKNKKQEIFGNFYNDVFNEDKINAEYILLPYLLYSEIETYVKNYRKKITNLKREGKEENLKKMLEEKEFLLYSHYYLLLTLKLLAEKNKIPIEYSRLDNIWKNFNTAMGLLRDIVKTKKQDPKFSLTYLFKEDELVNQLKSEVNKI